MYISRRLVNYSILLNHASYNVFSLTIGSFFFLYIFIILCRITYFKIVAYTYKYLLAYQCNLGIMHKYSVRTNSITSTCVMQIVHFYVGACKNLIRGMLNALKNLMQWHISCLHCFQLHSHILGWDRFWSHDLMKSFIQNTETEVIVLTNQLLFIFLACQHNHGSPWRIRTIFNWIVAFQYFGLILAIFRICIISISVIIICIYVYMYICIYVYMYICIHSKNNR